MAQSEGLFLVLPCPSSQQRHHGRPHPPRHSFPAFSTLGTLLPAPSPHAAFSLPALQMWHHPECAPGSPLLCAATLLMTVSSKLRSTLCGTDPVSVSSQAPFHVSGLISDFRFDLSSWLSHRWSNSYRCEHRAQDSRQAPPSTSVSSGPSTSLLPGSLLHSTD